MSDQGKVTGGTPRTNPDLVEGIVETSPVGIVVVDADGEVSFANERAEEIYGRSREEIGEFSHDDPRWDLVDETGEPIEDGEAPFDRVVAREEAIYDQILGLRRPSGERVWVSVNGAPQWTEDGDLERVVFSFEDVTEQRELETELDEILGRVTDAFYALDEEFRFTHVNERAEELLQAAEEELLGEKLWEVYPEAAEIDDVWDAFHAAMETQESQSYELYFDPLDFWVEATVYPSETGVSVYFRDVTERTERERALRESERRYRALVENFPNGAVAFVDDELNYRAVGGEPTEVAGVTAEEVVNRPVRDAVPSTVADEIVPRYEAAFEGEPSAFEAEFDDRVYRFQIVPIRDDDGDVSAALGMSQDVTERLERERQLEELIEKLEESNERLRQFAYAASHDLQEPLRMVSSYLQLIEDRYSDELDEDAEEFLEFAVDGADRMREMIDGLLEYSRIETKGEPFEPVDLDAVLDDVLADLQFQIGEADAEIAAGELPRVEGDASQLRQVFQNLLENAIEYSGDEPPRVHVTAARSGPEWEISVRDEGIGIDPDETDAIFDVFERLHSREEHAGTGIGLALCERIVERHGGDIWAESEPGDGATFSFTVPAANGHDRDQN